MHLLPGARLAPLKDTDREFLASVHSRLLGAHGSTIAEICAGIVIADF